MTDRPTGATDPARDSARDASRFPGRRLIGPHLPISGGLLKAAARAEQIGATAIQVFTDNPTAWRRREQPPAELDAFRRRLAASGIGPIAVHAPYLVNLCGANDAFWHRSVTTMANELRVATLYGASYVVMHIGSHRGLERVVGIDRLVRGLAEVLEQADQSVNLEPGPAAAEPLQGRKTADRTDRLPLLVLENAAGAGDGIGATLEDLADILAAAGAAGVAVDRLGVCLDTAHLWGAGYDIGDDAGVEHLVARVDELIGRQAVSMLHLNDSRTSLGSRLDRHEHIGAGRLGSDGMRELVGHPWLATLPTYLETPGMDSGYDQVNLDRVRQLLEGGKLPELPREAFELRRSSARTPPPTS